MKCPGCEFVCSDLRDVCPKCYLDLRPQKKLLGLQITNPEASYNELLGGAKGKSAESSAAAGSRSLWSALREALAGGRGAAGQQTEPPTASPTAALRSPAPDGDPRDDHAEAPSAGPSSAPSPATAADPKPAPLPEFEIREAAAQTAAPPVLDLTQSEAELDSIIDKMIGDAEIKYEVVEAARRPAAVTDIEIELISDEPAVEPPASK